jgi:phosphoribosylformylglycinamidine cyclo-ligase
VSPTDFFNIGGYGVNDTIPELKKSVGLTLLEPHINYTNHVFTVLDENINVKGIAHITGGGLVENIPRILPDGCGVEIQKGSWLSLPVFDVMQSIGEVKEDEMYRAFNMGIGMVFIVNPADMDAVKNATKNLTEVYEIGSVFSGNKNVTIT